MINYKYLFLSIAVVGVVACSSDKKGDEPTQEIEAPTPIVFHRAAAVSAEQEVDMNLSSDEKKVASADTEFALKFLSRFNDVHPNTNFVMSPLSLSTCFAMLANGADGSTLDELTTTLWGNCSMEQVNSYYEKVTSSMTHLDESVTFNVANSIWLAHGITVQDEFAKTITGTYHADVAENVFFGSKVATDAISDWASNATNGLIQNFGEHFHYGVITALMNAMYFNGLWTDAFDESVSKPCPFTNENGVQEMPIMMGHHIDEFVMYRDNDLAMVELNYGKNNKYYLELLLPATTSSVKEMLKGLTISKLNQIDAQRSTGHTSISMPRFEISTDYDKLPEILQELGLKRTLDGSGDYSRLLKEGFIIVNDVVQSARIKVNEQGTEAAVVTSINGDGDAGDLRNDFIANRPFIFLLRERTTGAIIMAGKYASAGK